MVRLHKMFASSRTVHALFKRFSWPHSTPVISATAFMHLLLPSMLVWFSRGVCCLVP
jgi:hypothetical protein